MEIIELVELSRWYKSYFKHLRERFNELHSVLNNNATQPNQQPVETPLDNLISFLNGMHVGELSIQQLRMLEDLKIGDLVGPAGAQFVERTVRTATYDPASTNATIEAAIGRLGEANQRLTAYHDAATNLGIEPDTFAEGEDRVIVRIGFKNDAAIENVVDWKVSSEDWLHIIRGLALVAGEAPENTKVLGATRGSLILVLSATYAVTALLAGISKHITGIAKSVLEIRVECENLRQKKLLTKAMATELGKLEKKAREDGIKAINKEISDMLPAGSSGEAKNALENSIKKLIAFGEDGGDIDFVAPPDDEHPNEGGAGDANKQPNDALAEIERVRRIVHEYQAEREATRLLEDKSR